MFGTHFAIDSILLEERECISKSSTSTLCDDLECFFFGIDSLSFTDVSESFDDIRESYLPEVEAESSRAYRLGDFLYLSRRQDEFYMFRRLFESFEESIECSCREHMDLIYDIDFVLGLVWFEARTFDEITDILYSVIARTIDLDDIEESIIIECDTVFTGVARISFCWVFAVQRLREYTSTRRLSCSA